MLDNPNCKTRPNMSQSGLQIAPNRPAQSHVHDFELCTLRPLVGLMQKWALDYTSW